jgi:cyclase
MLKIRIIPCLDVRDGKVVKGVKFQNHEIVGDILNLAKSYSDEGADELVFYDITASPDGRIVDRSWIKKIAEIINIPFSVAGGIRSVSDAKSILENGADKISINSPALENPELINKLADRFGRQCVVVGIDSFEKDGEYFVYQNSGDASKIANSGRKTIEWVKEIQERGAGEIVLNCMNQDGVRKGYDILQLIKISELANVPLIASGGAGALSHFKDLFEKTNVTAALAASVFHKKIIAISELKKFLKENKIEVRI